MYGDRQIEREPAPRPLEGSEQGLLASYGAEKPLPLWHGWHDAGTIAQRLPVIGLSASARVHLTCAATSRGQRCRKSGCRY